MIGNWGLIDRETPQDALTLPSYMDGSEWQLVFSDEFNTDGRTFYPGDDPYWEAGEVFRFYTWADIPSITESEPAILGGKSVSLKLLALSTYLYSVDR